MRATVTVETDILNKLLLATNAKSKTKAVNIAIAEFVRCKKVEKIQSMRGKLSFGILCQGKRRIDM